MPAKSIDDVIRALDLIIEEAMEQRDRLGFFAALYRQVTLKIKQGTIDGLFDDAERMNRLDTHFANRYLEALEIYRAGGRPTRSWRLTFESAQRSDLIILQHLLLGINAHINLDLGIASAKIAGADIQDLQGDFNKINDCLAALLDPAQEVIGEFSPLLDVLDKLGGEADERLANFSIDRARDDAWEQAEDLASQNEAQQQKTLNLIDKKTVFLGRLVASPPFIAAQAVQLIKWRESDDIPAIIHALNQIEPT